MNIAGLSSNFYLVDNPIYLTISEISPSAMYVEIEITNLSTQANSKPQRIYSLSDTVNIDIAPLIKSFMPEPKHNIDYGDLNDIPFYGNSINAKIEVKQFHMLMVQTNQLGRYVSERIERTKFFIRGGKRTYDANQNVSARQKLTPTDVIPTWPGYPVDFYTASATNGITKSNVIPENIRESRTVKGCNPQYVKFMNSLGGYSYWLFENWEEEESNKNIGDIQRQKDILDLGNDYDETIDLISKVPARFLPLMKDLIISKEIYLYDSDLQNWTRISSDNNKITTNPYSVNTKVKLKFKPFTRYNPALIW